MSLLYTAQVMFLSFKNTGCCLNGRTVQPPYKSLIFWSFPNVLSLFDHSIWAIFILVLLGHIIEKKVEKPHPQKRLDFRVGSNWLIFCWLKFGGCQLCVQLSWTFLHQFWKFLCPFCCKFPEFYDRPPTFQICMVWKDVMAKKPKNLEFRKLPNWANPEI